MKFQWHSAEIGKTATDSALLGEDYENHMVVATTWPPLPQLWALWLLVLGRWTGHFGGSGEDQAASWQGEAGRPNDPQNGTDMDRSKLSLGVLRDTGLDRKKRIVFQRWRRPCDSRYHLSVSWTPKSPVMKIIDHKTQNTVNNSWQATAKKGYLQKNFMIEKALVNSDFQSGIEKLELGRWSYVHVTYNQ